MKKSLQAQQGFWEVDHAINPSLLLVHRVLFLKKRWKVHRKKRERGVPLRFGFFFLRQPILKQSNTPPPFFFPLLFFPHFLSQKRKKKIQQKEHNPPPLLVQKKIFKEKR